MDTYQAHSSYNNAHFKLLALFYSSIEVLVGQVRKEVVRMIGNEPQTILDVACGPGAQSYELAKAGHAVIGIDLSPDMLKRAKRDEVLNLQYLEQDATKTKFTESEFDVSTISFGLHDMPQQIAVEVLKEMKRVTKPNGKIIIVDYNPPENFVNKTGLFLTRLIETKYYWHFVQTGLDKYLTEAKMQFDNKKTFLFGNIQLVEIINHK